MGSALFTFITGEGYARPYYLCMCVGFCTKWFCTLSQTHTHIHTHTHTNIHKYLFSMRKHFYLFCYLFVCTFFLIMCFVVYLYLFFISVKWNCQGVWAESKWSPEFCPVVYYSQFLFCADSGSVELNVWTDGLICDCSHPDVSALNQKVIWGCLLL